MPETHYWQAVRDALREEMIRDPKVFVMGEDVGIYGGAYGATRGLFEEFGAERVRDTAISEAAIAGAAVGAAMCGYRPVAEIMYMDFMTIAMDQFCNQGAKNRYMFGGRTTVPMVLRTECGAGRCIAAQHSQSLEAWFMNVPGILIVCPSSDSRTPPRRPSITGRMPTFGHRPIQRFCAIPLLLSRFAMLPFPPGIRL